MTRRRVIVLGSGKRVCEAVLPALACAPDRFELVRVCARTAKTVTAGGREYAVEPLADLAPDELASADLVVACVAKQAVPAVLATLAKSGGDLATTDLLIDTPVLLFKHLGHLARLDAFRNVWVAEDCTTLPALDAVQAFLATGAIGRLREVVWLQSAYAYHGIAMARPLFGNAWVSRASRTRWQGPYAERVIRFRGAGTLRVVEPRDYSIGHWLFLGERGQLADYPAKDHHLLAPLVENGRAVGFAVGDVEVRLAADELELLGEPRASTDGAALGNGVARWMEGMKRVGLLRLLRRIDAGEGAYPLALAVDDTVCDYHLEKLGRYVANPLTTPRFASARLALRALTGLAGK